jgi:hypothetical protein
MLYVLGMYPAHLVWAVVVSELVYYEVIWVFCNGIAKASLLVLGFWEFASHPGLFVISFAESNKTAKKQGHVIERVHR